jgi:FAD/FMN-containing dehydrogenase
LFAVRSGGHTPWPGAANIKDGVTIDLSWLNQTVYNAEKSIASLGSGATWNSVYAELDKLKVSVPGGRASSVGVGGLILGGKNWSSTLAVLDSWNRWQLILHRSFWFRL